jgi:DNA-binding XRE family transcriptional regulator
MYDKLLTKKDLAKRWQVSEQTINSYLTDGLIKPVKGIPSIRFNLQYIEKLEGIELDEHSPFEFRRLKRELEEVKQERDFLRKVVDEMNLVTAKAMVAQAQKCV